MSVVEIFAALDYTTRDEILKYLGPEHCLELVFGNRTSWPLTEKISRSISRKIQIKIGDLCWAAVGDLRWIYDQNKSLSDLYQFDEIPTVIHYRAKNRRIEISMFSQQVSSIRVDLRVERNFGDDLLIDECVSIRFVNSDGFVWRPYARRKDGSFDFVRSTVFEWASFEWRGRMEDGSFEYHRWLLESKDYTEGNFVSTDGTIPGYVCFENDREVNIQITGSFFFNKEEFDLRRELIDDFEWSVSFRK